jgi:hypothetical protein
LRLSSKDTRSIYMYLFNKLPTSQDEERRGVVRADAWETSSEDTCATSRFS